MEEVIKVKLVTGEEVEAVVKPLLWREVKELRRKFIKVNKLNPQTNEMEGNFDFEGLSEACILRGVKCDRLNELDPLEADRIYNKYYAKYFNPNLEGDAEKK